MSNDNDPPCDAEKNERRVTAGDEEDAYLFAFDFDNTIVADNSDCVVKKLTETPVPDHVEKTYDGTNWPEYMNAVFGFLNDVGVSVTDISRLVANMDVTKGMLDLLTLLVRAKAGGGVTSPSRSPRINLLIVSDANQLFIEEFLKRRVIDPLVSSSNLNNSSSSTSFSSPFDIVTNGSSVVDGALRVSPYENQTNCTICPKNLCKGSAISAYVRKHGRPFTRTVFVGDGRADLCAALSLKCADLAFARKHYPMHKMAGKSGVTARLVIWEDATAIQSTIKQAFPFLNNY